MRSRFDRGRRTGVLVVTISVFFGAVAPVFGDQPTQPAWPDAALVALGSDVELADALPNGPEACGASETNSACGLNQECPPTVESAACETDQPRLLPSAPAATSEQTCSENPICGDSKSPPQSLAEMMPSAAFDSLVSKKRSELSSVSKQTMRRMFPERGVTRAPTEKSMPESQGLAAPTQRVGEVSSHKTCVLRDPGSSDPVATIRMPGRLETTSIDEVELEQRRLQSIEAWSLAAEERKRKKSDAAETNQPQLSVSSDIRSGTVEVHAINADLVDLLRELSANSDIPIVFSPKVKGTISAKFATTNLSRSLRDLLEPFHFAVVHEGHQLIIHPVGEPLAVAPQREMTPRPLPTPLPAVPQPPVQQVSAAPVAIPNPVQLAAAHSTVLATQQRPAAAPRMTEPKPKAPVPLPNPTEQKINAIAYVAQDAFAASRDQYAIELLQEGVARYPHANVLWRLLGEGYLLGGQLKEAEKALSRVVQKDKTDRLANQLLGETLIQLGQKQRGNHYLLQAKSVAP